MKLNPPETAPKDGSVFFGHFYRTQQLWPAKWDVTPGKWSVVGYANRGFLAMHVDEQDLTEWTPLPTIDHEGNVT